jgi:hypothetical protein
MPCLTVDIPNYYTTAKEEAKWYTNDVDTRKGDRKNIPGEFGMGNKSGRKINTISDDFDALYAQIDQFLQIRKAIDRSKAIQQLDDDWDDEGSEGYTASTWQRVADFVSAQANAARNSGLLIGVPVIAPADRGSIDIHWRNADCDLLINVPAQLQKPGTYYGSNQRGETVSGRLDTQGPRSDLLLWLTNRR